GRGNNGSPVVHPGHTGNRDQRKTVCKLVERKQRRRGQPPFNLREVGTLRWGFLLDGYNRAVQQLPASQQNTPKPLLMAVAGPMMTSLDRALTRGIGPLVVGLGLVARQPVAFTQLTGTLEQAVDDLVERMVRANPELGR